jgi:hypothetical protein
MNRYAILTGASVILALAGSGESVAAQHPVLSFAGPKIDAVVRHTPGMKVLFTENTQGSGNYINSQNYTSGLYTSYNDQAADDFVVPRGRTWTIKEIDVTGCCSYTPISEDVYFYRNDHGLPGKPVKGGSFTDLAGTSNPSFAISLGKGVTLKAGHYWVSVVANCSATGDCGAWGWEERYIVVKDPGVFRQPGNGAGMGCINWTVAATCTQNTSLYDFMFELQGNAK